MSSSAKGVQACITSGPTRRQYVSVLEGEVWDGGGYPPWLAALRQVDRGPAERREQAPFLIRKASRTVHVLSERALFAYLHGDDPAGDANIR